MKVKAYVHVISEDGSQRAILAPGDTVPDWATVTNPDALDGDAPEVQEAPDGTDDDAPTPKRAPSRKAPARK